MNFIASFFTILPGAPPTASVTYVWRYRQRYLTAGEYTLLVLETWFLFLRPSLYLNVWLESVAYIWDSAYIRSFTVLGLVREFNFMFTVLG